MSDAPDASEMFTGMLMATGILNGAVDVLVVDGIVVYHKTAVHHGAGASHKTIGGRHGP